MDASRGYGQGHRRTVWNANSHKSRLPPRLAIVLSPPRYMVHSRLHGQCLISADCGALGEESLGQRRKRMVGDDVHCDASSDEPEANTPSDLDASRNLTGDVTQILSAMEQGDGQAAEQLLPLVYEELRKLAAGKMAQEKPGQTLQATALVHEAYVRLVDVATAQHWDSRRHFFAAAAEAMRRILIDNARRKERPKYGGGRNRVDLDGIAPIVPSPNDDAVAVDEALTKLGKEDNASAELVKLRYYCGLPISQIAALLGVAPRTADRRWAYARAWLRQELYAD